MSVSRVSFYGCSDDSNDPMLGGSVGRWSLVVLCKIRMRPSSNMVSRIAHNSSIRGNFANFVRAPFNVHLDVLWLCFFFFLYASLPLAASRAAYLFLALLHLATLHTTVFMPVHQIEPLITSPLYPAHMYGAGRLANHLVASHSPVVCCAAKEWLFFL